MEHSAQSKVLEGSEPVVSKPEPVASKPNPEVMVVGELHNIVDRGSLATDLCNISVEVITSIIEEKTDPSNSKILFVSEGYEENKDFSTIRKKLASSGYTVKNFMNMIELSERTLELNPHLKSITKIHSILLLLRDLDHYQSNPDDRMNTQFNMKVDINYFRFLLCNMYRLHEIFDENVQLHCSYISNIIVYKRNVFGDKIFNYDASFKVILNWIHSHFFDSVSPSIQAIITELIETKTIGERLDKYDRFRTTLREIRDNILVSRIEKNASNFDFIVVIFGCGHYENICKLIDEREELVLSTESFNSFDPSHLVKLEQRLISSLISSSFASI